MFLSGLKNCHLPGLDSYVISERQDATVGMKRIFHLRPDAPPMDVWDEADFYLKPHNHKYNLKITKLFGTVRNLTLDFHNYGKHELWCYDFRSGLNQDFGLTKMWQQRADVKTKELANGESVSLCWNVVHTVNATPDSAWMVEEFEDAPVGTNRLWSRNHELTLSPVGLYVPMSQLELTIGHVLLKPFVE